MDTWTCPHCGFTPDTQDQTPSGACPKCGAPIATESPAEKATPPADATPGQSTEGTPETQAEPSPDAEATPEAEAPSEAGRGGAWRERLAALRARLAETARDGWEKAKPWVDAAGPRLRAAYETAKAKTPDGLKKVGGFLDRIRPYCRRFFLWSRSCLPPIFLDRALLCGGCFTLARGISRFFHFENSKRPKHDFWVTVILLRVALFCTPLLVLEAVATFDFRALLQIQIALGFTASSASSCPPPAWSGSRPTSAPSAWSPSAKASSACLAKAGSAASAQASPPNTTSPSRSSA